MAPLLALDHVAFLRPERTVLQDIHWQVAPSQIAAIVGANGCGKSTLLRMVSGYLWPTRGTVTLLGHRLGEYPVQTLRQQIGIVEASSVYPFDEKMTALEVVCSGFFTSLTLDYVDPTPEQWQRSQEDLAQVGLGDRAEQKYATLSTGQKMRVLIARALVRQPTLLLLDEPTAGLDLPARETVLATLAALRRQRSATPPAVIMVTHHLEELLPETSNVLLLGTQGNTVASGMPETVLTDANLTAAFRWPIQVHRQHGRYFAHALPQEWKL